MAYLIFSTMISMENTQLNYVGFKWVANEKLRYVDKYIGNISLPKTT